MHGVVDLRGRPRVRGAHPAVTDPSRVAPMPREDGHAGIRAVLGFLGVDMRPAEAMVVVMAVVILP